MLVLPPPERGFGGAPRPRNPQATWTPCADMLVELEIPPSRPPSSLGVPIGGQLGLVGTAGAVGLTLRLTPSARPPGTAPPCCCAFRRLTGPGEARNFQMLRRTPPNPPAHGPLSITLPRERAGPVSRQSQPIATMSVHSNRRRGRTTKNKKGGGARETRRQIRGPLLGPVWFNLMLLNF